MDRRAEHIGWMEKEKCNEVVIEVNVTSRIPECGEPWCCDVDMKMLVGNRAKFARPGTQTQKKEQEENE